MNLIPRRGANPLGTALLASAIGAGLLAVLNVLAARRAERRNPAAGAFLDVDGIRLHYTDRGEGSPVVLIHGNALAGNDYDMSGLTGLLLKTHRVIVFDRPGFGYSERPRGRVWTADQQAELLHKALTQLGVERPVVVGHSFGAIVALSLAVRHQADVSGLVLVSGYYFWTLRPDTMLVSVEALPGLGDLLRYTIAPLLGWLTMPVFKRIMFAPARIPGRFQAQFSPAMTLRPSQIRATAVDGALMIPAVLGLDRHYRNLQLPVVIFAGSGDRVVFKSRAKQLHARIKGSVLHIIEGAGHMVHYQAPSEIARAVDDIAPLSVERRPSVGGFPSTQVGSAEVPVRAA